MNFWHPDKPNPTINYLLSQKDIMGKYQCCLSPYSILYSHTKIRLMVDGNVLPGTRGGADHVFDSV